MKTVFLSINNEYIEMQIKNTVSFTITPNKMRCLGIHLIKHTWIYMLGMTKGG